jgi:hypothetical protein
MHTLGFTQAEAAELKRLLQRSVIEDDTYHPIHEATRKLIDRYRRVLLAALAEHLDAEFDGRNLAWIDDSMITP